MNFEKVVKTYFVDICGWSLSKVILENEKERNYKTKKYSKPN